MISIENAKVVLEHQVLEDGIILVENDRICWVGKRDEASVPQDAQRIDAQGAYVGPGFVDIHNHGGGGYRFDTDPVSAAKYFLTHGETTVLATLYYNLSKEEFLEATRRVIAAMNNPDGRNIGGCYMEGPYMNPKYGASPDKNRWKGPIKEEDYQALTDCAGSYAKVWAIAPERDGIEGFVAYAKAKNPNVRFAVGHSEATPAQVRKLKEYGLGIQTHCMNATGRNTQWSGTRGCGPDEACLLDKDMYAELICDSMAVHVNPDLQKLILQVKGVDKVVLITDSFVSDQQSPEDLRHITDLSFDENRNLCGSRLTMDVVCRNIMKHTGCTLTQAFLMAATNPAKAVGMDADIGSVAPGKKANLVFVDGAFQVKKVMLNGQLC